MGTIFGIYKVKKGSTGSLDDVMRVCGPWRRAGGRAGQGGGRAGLATHDELAGAWLGAGQATRRAPAPTLAALRLMLRAGGQ